MLLLWAILLMVLAIGFTVFAWAGIAIAIPFFTKILIFLAFSCFVASLILIIIEKIKVKEEQEEQIEEAIEQKIEEEKEKS